MSSGVEKTILPDEYNVKSRVSQAYSTFFCTLENTLHGKYNKRRLFMFIKEEL